MSRKNRTYHFYNTTASVCTQCLERVEAKVIFKEEKVYLEKWCPDHGHERVMLSDDVSYYRLCREVYIKAPEMPERFNTSMAKGCPFDCGLCPDHMQHSCLTVMEITERCNLQCPVCYAGSGPGVGRHRTMAEIEAMLDTLVANEGEPDVLQLSGGEPTEHPEFFAILDAARRRPIRHLMINTNGIRLAQDEAFVTRLASYGAGIEIYLQFDSLDDAVLRELRGADLARLHQRALDQLNRYNISTTLVMTLRKGLNEQQIGAVIRHGLAQPCVRGVTLQPIQQAGRLEGFDGDRHRLTVSELRRLVAEQSQLFTLEDMVPVPCNPDTLAMGYALKLGGEVKPLTRYLAPEVLLAGPRNTIVFERDPQLKQRLFSLLSTGISGERQASCLSDLLCCLPKIAAPALSYDNVFRVLIVQFMDAANLDIRALKKSCIHMVTPQGKMIPFETYNLFYRAAVEAEVAALAQQEEQPT